MFDWAEFTAELSGIIPTLAERRRAREAHLEETIEALRDAYYETVKYEEALVAGEIKSRAAELDFARAWERFATKMRRYDARLYDRLRLKERYWREGGTWNEEERRNARIGLERIRQDAELELLVRQPVPKRLALEVLLLVWSVVARRVLRYAA